MINCGTSLALFIYRIFIFYNLQKTKKFFLEKNNPKIIIKNIHLRTSVLKKKKPPPKPLIKNNWKLKKYHIGFLKN